MKNYFKFHAVLVTFTEDILNGKLHFLCSDKCGFQMQILKVDYKSEFQLSISNLEKAFHCGLKKY